MSEHGGYASENDQETRCLFAIAAKLEQGRR